VAFAQKTSYEALEFPAYLEVSFIISLKFFYGRFYPFFHLLFNIFGRLKSINDSSYEMAD